MGNFAAKPETEKEVHVGEGNGLRYCVSSMQGWRLEMEDAHTAVCGLKKPHESLSFFGVFDGHAGNHISLHCAEHLLTTITATDQFSKADFGAGLREGFLQLDREMRRISADKPGGSTATCVLVTPQRLYLANCGDSRAVLFRNGVTSVCTVDHRPTLAKEKARIENAGGSVMIDRVNGSLAVSRALGDYQFKLNILLPPTEQMVSPEPDIYVCERTLNDQFVVIACDGIWDVMTNEDVCAFIHSRLLVTQDLPEIVNSVLEVCLHKGSRDNMTLLLLLLPGAPTIDEGAVRRDQKLDRNLAQITREVIEKNDIYFFEDLARLMNRVAVNIPNLPPGGGIFAKYHIVQQVFHEVFPKKPCEYDEKYLI